MNFKRRLGNSFFGRPAVPGVVALPREAQSRERRVASVKYSVSAYRAAEPRGIPTLLSILILTCLLSTVSQAQVIPAPIAKPTPSPVKTPDATAAASGESKGTVAGRTYTNRKFGFEVTFPGTWLIPGDDFEEAMKKRGFDLGLKAPDSMSPVAQAKINRAVKNVTILLTAYRSMPGTDDNAIVRISVEDLSLNPQITDAVDYFDAMRATFKAMPLPADFTYSETQAEKLGEMQFGYIDTATGTAKKRMYATVRRGYAILFTLSYRADSDLVTMQRILEKGNFDVKDP
jgi:hypothetical protein